MIKIKEAYGILLTNELGHFHRDFKMFINMRPHDGYEENDSRYKFDHKHLTLDSFCESCTSKEDYQFVLGIEAPLSKNKDINLIHEKWLEYMENLPKEVKDIIEVIRKNTDNEVKPNFYRLSSKSKNKYFL